MVQESKVDYDEKDFISRILENAIQSRASDIHLDPTRDGFLVRFRIDGVLYQIEELSKEIEESVVSRTKILSQIDITERRIPQDGHFELSFQGRLYNFRVSTFPATFGEAVALRLLEVEDDLLELGNLGFEEDQLGDLKKLIHSPYGMALVTGPTGSGKSVLLYSILKELSNPRNNVVTIEDPIELQMEGVRQMDVREEVGLTFAVGLRSVLRQDPDILMVGEVRDSETAQLVAQAALAGRLVFSTFHTFDAPALILRLREMGIPTSIIGHALLGMISTRLVRKICPSCAVPYKPSQAQQRLLGEDASSGNLQKGQGCANCRNSGYMGRTGLFEIVFFDEKIQSLIIEKRPASELRSYLRESGHKTLWDAGYAKVLQGITTIEELVRVHGVPR